MRLTLQYDDGQPPALKIDCIRRAARGDSTCHHPRTHLSLYTMLHQQNIQHMKYQSTNFNHPFDETCRETFCRLASSLTVLSGCSIIGNSINSGSVSFDWQRRKAHDKKHTSVCIMPHHHMNDSTGSCFSRGEDTLDIWECPTRLRS